MRVLVVAAHPDDEILGAGATLAGHVDRGDDVHACILAEGATSRYEDAMVESLHEAGKRAGEVIGFSSVVFDQLPDQRLDTLPLITVTQRVEELVDALRPEVVYTHFPWDVNSDHGVVAQCVWTAIRPFRFPFVKCIAAFETPSSTEWAIPSPMHRFQPNRFVDVTATVERKLEAMACYRSELRDYPHPRSLRALRERAGYWGSVAGAEAVEPFMVLREHR
jgi:LmbE family N-acetylglucosaminyl deacetylase